MYKCLAMSVNQLSRQAYELQTKQGSIYTSEEIQVT
jgi:hypothetical protein